MPRDEPSFILALGECDEPARSSSMVLNVRTQSKFSFKVRMKRSATPLPSGSRTKDGRGGACASYGEALRRPLGLQPSINRHFETSGCGSITAARCLS
jgi:hypothetical protein